MMRYSALLLLFGAPLLVNAGPVENHEAVQEAARIPDDSMIDVNDLDDETLAMLRGSSSTEGDMHGRRLWGFSFTNLLFAVGVCPTDETQRQYCCVQAMSDGSDEEDGSNSSPPGHLKRICRKCPDCSKPLLPHDHRMCQCYGNEVYDATADYDVYEGNDADQGGSDAASSNGQSAKRRFNMWAYIVGGSGVALLIGALIMRKRQTDNENKAIASGSNSLSGSVAKRIEMMSSSDGAPSTIASEEGASLGPDFVEIENLQRSPTGISQIHEQGIELDGPAYPSSQGGSNYGI